MVKQKSTQHNQEKSKRNERQAIDHGNIVDVRIMRTETFATSNTLSFALTTNPQMCERIVRELKVANIEIQRHLDDIESSRLSRNLASLIIEKRSVMNRFSLIKSDCYWANLDIDLSNTIDMIDQCHDVLIGKFAEDFKLRDLLYVIDVFKKVQQEFERKIEQVEEVLG